MGFDQPTIFGFSLQSLKSVHIYKIEPASPPCEPLGHEQVRIENSINGLQEVGSDADDKYWIIIAQELEISFPDWDSK